MTSSKQRAAASRKHRLERLRTLLESRRKRDLTVCDFVSHAERGDVAERCMAEAAVWAIDERSGTPIVHSRCKGHPLGDKIMRHCVEMDANEVICYRILHR